jgi:Tfp pilus tip-associated adhesin PilY1
MKEKMVQGLLYGLLATVVSGLAFGGWNAAHLVGTLATKEEVKNQIQILEAKANTSLDFQIEGLVAQAAFLENKKGKSAEEINQLEYIRKRIEYLRKVQKQEAK